MAQAPLRAVILVGGEGTRLRPLTYTRPKQMCPVAGRPMLEVVLERLHAHGVTDAVLSLGYRPDAFLRAYPDGEAAGVRLSYAVESSPLDTAGAIRFAALEAGYDRHGETIVVVNGDVITDLDVSAQLAFHRRSGAEGTVALHEVDDPSAFGVVPTDADGRVLAFVEKPPRDQAPSRWINAGTYTLEPSALERIAADRKVSIEREVFPAMAAEGRLFGYAARTYWLDAGTPVSYLRANLDLAGDDGWVAPDAEVAGHVRRSVIGQGSRVEAGATVERAVLLPGAVVRAGARVIGSILGEGAVVGAGADVLDLSVVGDGVHVADGAELRGERLNPAGF